MMTSKITLTVALAAGLLLLALSDVGANPVAEKSADFPEPNFGGVEPEQAEMSDEDIVNLLVDCAVSRLKGVQLSAHDIQTLKAQLAKVNEVTKERPEAVGQQVLGFLLEQCLMEDLTFSE